MRLIDTTDERLYKECFKVENPKSLSIKMLRDKMIKTMYKENGIGLAAPQVGRQEALFVMHTDKGPITCINPEIIMPSQDECEMKERCLSFPGIIINLSRPSSVYVKYTDIRGIEISKRLDGIEARCFQHELDHLHGITFIHRQNEQI